MVKIKETDSFHAKEVEIDSDGYLEIYHYEESIIVDKIQAMELIEILRKYVETGDN